MGYKMKIALFFGLSPNFIKSIYPIHIISLRGIYYKFHLKKCNWGVSIDKYVNICGKKNVEIGHSTVINSFVHIWAGREGLVIGNRVMIASHVAITTLTHNYNCSNMRDDPAIDRRIFIKDDAWIGTHAIIMPGVTIGKGAVIGAGALVNEDVPDFAIVVGIPARILKFRKFID